MEKSEELNEYYIYIYIFGGENLDNPNFSSGIADGFEFEQRGLNGHRVSCSGYGSTRVRHASLSFEKMIHFSV